MTALWELAATELVAGYRARSFTPVEVVEALAERSDSVGAFTTTCWERALEEARTPRSGPLAGVPFAAKDLFDTAGVRTTYGSRMFASHVPAEDAPAVAAIRRAGAILVAKAQTHEFAWGITSVNEAMGSSRNPWMASRVPGGSSGGAAAALAAGLVPLAIGSDTGGSVRIPAAFCGVMGFKPTFGAVDATGVWPLSPSLDHVGPMARTPGDLALLSEAMGGRVASPGGARTIAVCPDLHLAAPLTQAVGRVFEQTVRVFERLGFRVEERACPSAGLIDEAFRTIQACEALEVHTVAGLYPERAEEYGADVRRRLEFASGIDTSEYVRAASAREAVRADLGRLLADGALLLTPVSAVSPVEADDFEAARLFRAGVLPYTTPHNLAGLPSCAVRAGFDDEGLPVGVQIAGAAWREGDVLAAAGALYEATPDVQARRPPG